MLSSIGQLAVRQGVGDLVRAKFALPEMPLVGVTRFGGDGYTGGLGCGRGMGCGGCQGCGMGGIFGMPDDVTFAGVTVPTVALLGVAAVGLLFMMKKR